MELFSRDDLQALLANRAAPCLSLFMPTTRGPGQEDWKRWKNLVREAEERLTAAGVRRGAEADDLLRPARDLLVDAAFWLNVSEGLVVFLSPEGSHHYRLPIPFTQQLIVGDRFHVKPLLPLLTGDGRFYVLALSQKKVRLLAGTRHTVGEIDLQDVPASYQEALRYEEADLARTGHAHRAAGGTATVQEAVPHGHGTAVESNKEDLEVFCQRVAGGVERLLHDEEAPLVLAGVDYLLAIYRKANNFRNLLPGAVEGNPDLLSPQQLHDRAWAVVEPYFQQEQKRLTALYRQYAGTGRTTDDLAAILSAASEGTLQFLLVAPGQQRWGTFDPATKTVQVHDKAEPGDEDLLNLAVVHTLSHKGTVYTVEADQGLDGLPLAGIFWMPAGQRSSKRTL